MGFSDEFFAQVGEAMAPTRAHVSRIGFSTIAKPWLRAGYQVIRATTPVLRYALSRTTQHDEPVAKYYLSKLKDEAGHDEMFLRDLRGSGIVTQSDEFNLNPFVAEMVGRQYYLVDFVHPSVYLGYIGQLEGFPVTVDQVDELARMSGLPSAAFRTLRMHAVVDVKHREDLARMLDATPSNLHHAILDNGIRCAELHRAALMYLSTEKQYAHGPQQHSPGVDAGGASESRG